MLETRGDSETVVDWTNVYAKFKAPVGTTAGAEVSTFGDVPLVGLFPSFVNMTRRLMSGR